MAFQLHLPIAPCYPFRSRAPKHACYVPYVRCKIEDQQHASSNPLQRSANWAPTLWEDNYIQSLASEYTEETHGQSIEKLKEDVRSLMYKEKELVSQLELVDVIQQLGVAYHFEKEIKDVLGTLFRSMDDMRMLIENDLYASSLLFRLLRGNGFFVSQDLFKTFMDEEGNFKGSLRDDINGILSLYEASYLAMPGEPVLDEAMEFTKKHLKHLLEGGLLMNPSLKEKIAYALEIPLNVRVNRIHARWFIERFENEESMNPILLEFAKLDFNMIQNLYKQELKQVSGWWTNLGLIGDQKLSFVRDRLAECHIWAIGACFEPKFSKARIAMTKVSCLITTIDDIYDVIYDVYGSLDKLELFTEAVDRWDVNAIDRLPVYMQICFLGLFNTWNDTAFEILKEKGLQTIHGIRRAWVDLCKGYLVEAKWLHSGYTPTLEEYLENAWKTIGIRIFVVAACSVSQDMTKETLQGFESFPDVVRIAGLIARLLNDLGTSKDEFSRGDILKAIQCYMHEKGVLEDEARKHLRDLISAMLKEVNRYHIASSTDDLDPEPLRAIVMNAPGICQWFYQHGDGFGTPEGETKDQIMRLLTEPIPLAICSRRR